MNIPIVDENDNVIGEISRETSRGEKNIYRVSALWVVSTSGEACNVLIAQRALTKKHHPGIWGPSAAGTVEVGETYLENITKEASEELGLSDVKFTELYKEKVAGDFTHFTQWFLAFCDWPIEKFTKQDEEVDAIKWVAIDGLIDDVRNFPDRYLASFLDEVLRLKSALGKEEL
jgi:isopentenyldiphosphate isomerase